MSMPSGSSGCFRYFAAFVAATCGVVGVMIEIHFLPKDIPPGSFAETLVGVDLSVTFYGCTYGGGRLFYWLLRRVSEERELARWSRAHVLVLHSLAFIYSIIASFAGEHRLPVLRPAVIISGALVAITIAAIISERRRHGGTTNRTRFHGGNESPG